MRRTNCVNNRNRGAILAAATAALGAVVSPAMADWTGGSSQEYVIPTTGATALAAFTTAASNRGPYLLGQASLTIGATTYTINTVNGQAYGIQNKNSINSAVEPATTADRIVYQYHSTGSVNGIREVARAQGLLGTSAFPVSATNQLFVMGQPLNSLDGGALTNGYNSTVGATYEPVIAYSDVRADQAFRIPGTGAHDLAPTSAGYGQGRAGVLPGVNFQRLTDVSGLDDPTDTFAAGLDTLNNRVRNESLAVVPFTISASPGTGLDSLSEEDVRFLHTNGRLQNGANFNNSTRDIGSGTRNQGDNNFNIDPSWGSGERDRQALEVTNHFDVDGNPVAIQIGDEQSPERGIRGEATVSQNEHRPSAIRRSADKTSGSTGVRQTVLSTRMSLGVLSAGDVGSRGKSSSTATPLRVLAIDFDEDNSLGGEPAAGAVQPNFADVTEGRYQMWSASQAVTITVPGGGSLDIKGDISDGSATGVGRKFLDNITSSIGSGPNPTTPATPFDAVYLAGFIPGQAMAIDKAYDGATQVSSPRSTTPNPETGFSEQDIWNGLNSIATPYIRAGDLNGNIAAQKYHVYDVNTGTTSGTATGDVQIAFTNRIFLAGDMNGDSVRDLADVPALAQAYANTPGYLAANPTVTTGAATVTSGNLDTSAMTSEGHYALLAMSDLDGDGNVQVVDDYGLGSGNAKDKVVAVSREDVKFFLYGASVDTSNANPATGYAGSSNAQTRRELGVRQGRLKKNAAIDAFNAELQSMANAGTISQGTADDLMFNKFDIDMDGDLDRNDAKIVDRNVGRNFTNLTDVLSTTDDLVAAELTDNDLVTNAATGPLSDGTGTSDFKLIRTALGAGLFNGDCNFDGMVTISDLGDLASNWQSTNAKWSSGDFNFDGAVTISDLGDLASNWQAGVGAGLSTMSFQQALAAVGLGGDSVPEPAAMALLGIGATTILRRRRR